MEREREDCMVVRREGTANEAVMAIIPGGRKGVEEGPRWNAVLGRRAGGCKEAGAGGIVPGGRKRVVEGSRWGVPPASAVQGPLCVWRAEMDVRRRYLHGS